MSRKKITFEGIGELPFDWDETPEETSGRRSVYDRMVVTTVTEEPASSDGLIYYLSLASGSSGNSCYIGTSKGGVIIDAGIRADEIEAKIKANGIDIKKVHGVLLTHDHADHVKYAYSLVRNNRHMKVFCTNRVLNALLRHHGMSKRIKDYHVAIFKEIPFKTGDMEITAFEVPHDGTDNMGYSISSQGRNFVLATDMGEVHARARHYMSLADYLVIESNYDLPMLIRGRYPEFLKARIQTERGHMDNDATAGFIKEIYSKRLRHIFLCHLSKDNNLPEIAYQKVRTALEEVGAKIGNGMETLEDREADVQLTVLPRHEATRLYVFRP